MKPYRMKSSISLPTSLIATHDLRQVERLGKRTIHLANGQLLGDGAQASVLEQD